MRRFAYTPTAGKSAKMIQHLFFSTKYDIIKKNACSTAGTLPLRLHGMDSVGFAGGSCLKFRTLRMGGRLMISLFLVEDERIARESIRDNVPWQEHDILFLGDAPDGRSRSAAAPGKTAGYSADGHQDAVYGRPGAGPDRAEGLPDTRIIILSGHNEFEYARKAITLGVNDYLLKLSPAGIFWKPWTAARRRIFGMPRTAD